MKIGELIALNIFPLCMIYAAFSDLLTMKIPNWLSASLALMFVPILYFGAVDSGFILEHVLSGGLVLIVGFILFSLGWMGGGDAKLASATALWLGWASTLDYIILTSFLGGVLTLALLAMRRVALPHFTHKWHWLVHLHQPTTGVPYGIALACAAMWVFPTSPVWTIILK
jgi:prepilin peptidase CpaA